MSLDYCACRMFVAASPKIYVTFFFVFTSSKIPTSVRGFGYRTPQRRKTWGRAEFCIGVGRLIEDF
ncbi:hypothetical protein L873DRAFT_740489 [Choiromyces venosus 120613-1]|uniref:Uncharacterized protein n=1 Tax=Choiromyces venosus 120613-1 TaxID=1336337 RepID=A0A3N4JV93_9PEZI|nr:hypothetical protein L873DRAFT_740489 [Choiromyces venosus 120613-1]